VEQIFSTKDDKRVFSGWKNKIERNTKLDQRREKKSIKEG
jgi:hypothetical protein